MTSISATGQDGTAFALFPTFPAEIRIKIWEAAITPRIVRCQRTDGENAFTAPSKSLPLLQTCRESRETAFLYGGYLLLTTFPCEYFSPKVDYLLFDVGWIKPHVATFTPPIRQDFLIFLESIDPNLLSLRNIMVHPNWSEDHMMPTVALGQFMQLERVLVAADEKSVRSRTDVLFSTVHDIRMYYAQTRKFNPELSTPNIAVGCLGWTGPERWSLHHGSHDNRQLVAVFQDYAAMKEHQRLLREEEMRFTKERFAHRQPSFMQKLRQAREASESDSKSKAVAPVSLPPPPAAPSPPPFVPSQPPAYEDAMSTPIDAAAPESTPDVQEESDS